MADAPRYEKILVGSDGSERAGRAVARAAELARLMGASLTVLGVGAEAKLKPGLEAQVQEHRDSGVHIEIRIESGHPAETLIDVAGDGGYDLLVVGNKGMSGLERFMLGSVPNKISHNLSCSLLVVRTG